MGFSWLVQFLGPFSRFWVPLRFRYFGLWIGGPGGFIGNLLYYLERLCLLPSCGWMINKSCISRLCCTGFLITIYCRRMRELLALDLMDLKCLINETLKDTTWFTRGFPFLCLKFTVTFKILNKMGRVFFESYLLRNFLRIHHHYVLKKNVGM